MRDGRVRWFLAGLFVALGGGLAIAVLPTPAAPEEAYWIDYLIPRPKEIRITGRRHVATRDVILRGSPDGGPISRQALAELQALLAGADPAAPAPAPLPAPAPAPMPVPLPDAPAPLPSASTFSLILGLADDSDRVLGLPIPDASRLRQLPNRDQAYLIRPAAPDTLVIAALDEKGLYYGVQTLKQLLAPFIRGGRVLVPLAVVTDWPDLEERGLWNSGRETPGFVPWLAGLKLNFEHIPHPVSFKPGEERCPPLPRAEIEAARSRAFHLLPHCAHFDFWRDHNREHYPAELAGKGETARHPANVRNPQVLAAVRAPCASQPSLERYLTEWLVGAARQGALETSLWLTEYQPCYCSCDACLPDKAGRPRQLPLETAASVRAIQAARRQFPGLAARIFFTTQGEHRQADAAECLALLPADGSIKAEVVYGRQEAFDRYAAAGGWVATYSGDVGVIGNAWSAHRGVFFLRFVPGPASVRDCIRSYAEAGYRGLYIASSIYAGGPLGKGHVERNTAHYLIHMLAEWSWNSAGRSAEEFNLAWAARRGYADRDKAARWLRICLPIEAAVFQAMDRLPDLTEALKSGVALEWGAGGLDGIPSSERFEELRAEARRAARIAADLEAPDLVAESAYLEAALQMIRRLRELSPDRASRASQEACALGLEALSADVERMLAAAGRQADAWTDTPEAVRQEFLDLTRTFWSGKIEAIKEAVSPH